MSLTHLRGRNFESKIVIIDSVRLERLSALPRVTQQLEFNPALRRQALSQAWPPTLSTPPEQKPGAGAGHGLAGDTLPICARAGPDAQAFSVSGPGLPTIQAVPVTFPGTLVTNTVLSRLWHIWHPSASREDPWCPLSPPGCSGQGSLLF